MLSYSSGQLAELARPVEDMAGTSEFALASLESALDCAALDDFHYGIKRSGSAPLNTGVEGTSDLDFQVVLHDTADNPGMLAQATKAQRFATYQDFYGRVHGALKNGLKNGTVEASRKCIDIQHPDLLLPTDVTPCLGQAGAIELWTDSEKPAHIISFPEKQLANSEAKQERTEGVYLETVRVLKVIRNILAERGDLDPDDARSYHLMSAIYSMPDSRFEGGLAEAVTNAIGYMSDPRQLRKARMLHGKYWLVGTNTVQWHPERVSAFLQAVAHSS